MIALLCFVVAVLALPFRSKSCLEAENAVLRHQLLVLRRKVRGRVGLTNNDRLFFIQLYRWFPSIPEGHHDHPPRDARALASSRLSPVLVLEIAVTRRPTADRHGPPRANTADEQRDRILGGTAHPRPTAQARLWRRAVHSGQVHGHACRSAVAA